jgi:hypothetical protein
LLVVTLRTLPTRPKNRDGLNAVTNIFTEKICRFLWVRDRSTRCSRMIKSGNVTQAGNIRRQEVVLDERKSIWSWRPRAQERYIGRVAVLLAAPPKSARLQKPASIFGLV